MTLWHIWQNFHFITWLLGVWQRPDFVRLWLDILAIFFWLSLRWNTGIQRQHTAEAKFRCLWTKCPNLGQNCHNVVCHIFWPFIRTLCDTVTPPIFQHVRYPLWRVTDKSVEINHKGPFLVSIPSINFLRPKCTYTISLYSILIELSLILSVEARTSIVVTQTEVSEWKDIFGKCHYFWKLQ